MTRIIRGIPASAGIAIGPPWAWGEEQAAPVRAELPPEAVAAELDRLRAALQAAQAELRALAAAADGTATAVLDAQRLLLEDPELIEAIAALVREERAALPWAVHCACERYAEALAALADPYIRERAADVRDVGRRLVRLLGGAGGPGSSGGSGAARPAPDRPSVLFARELTPSEIAGLPADRVLALVSETGSAAGHAAILARARGIPAVVGAVGACALAEAAALVVVDGERGTVQADPPPETLEQYRRELAARARVEVRPAGAPGQPAATRDGLRVEVDANIGGPDEVARALANGADGVGLLRSEYLFMGGARLPDEEEQCAAYAAAIAGMQGRPVIIRTLDVGGDKEVPALALPREPNPSLGWRAIRLCLDRPELLRTQLRAIYRASVRGKVGIMFPLISSLDEVERAKEICAQVRAELDRAGVQYDRRVELGVMIETPAAALLARHLGCAVDFFSIGTNDLTQYALAVDRTNERVAGLYDSLHPAVLRLVAEAVRGASENGIRVGMCGELAGDPAATELLIGLGVTALSVSAPLVGPIKERVRAATAARARELAARALACGTPQEVRELLRAAAEEWAWTGR